MVKVYVAVKRKLQVATRWLGVMEIKVLFLAYCPSRYAVLPDGTRGYCPEPLGVPSRMNVGQCWRLTGWAAKDWAATAEMLEDYRKRESFKEKLHGFTTSWNSTPTLRMPAKGTQAWQRFKEGLHVASRY